MADDGSTDGSLDVLAEIAAADLRVVVLAEARRGQPAAMRNAALRRARGRFLAFLDSDDLFHPEKLDRQVNRLRASGADVTYSWAEEFFDSDSDSVPPVMWPRIDLEGDAFARLAERGNMVCTSSLLITRAAFEKVGFFDEAPELRAAEDYDYILRLARHFHLVRTEGMLVRYRLHPNNVSRAMPFARTEAIKARLEQRGDLVGPLRGRYLSGFHLSRAEHALRSRDWSAARRDFLRAVLLQPRRLVRWPGLLSWLLPGPLFLRLYVSLKRLQVRLQGSSASPHSMANPRGG